MLWPTFLDSRGRRWQVAPVFCGLKATLVGTDLEVRGYSGDGLRHRAESAN